jgi:uncharacterized protein (DUF169 family)
MSDYRRLEQQLASDLGLTRRPVAVSFRGDPPAGVTAFVGVQPSGCSFWKLASDGRTFYTVAADHYNCPIGSYTHNISPPAERAGELEETLGFMANVGYIRMEEVPSIPRLAATPGVVVYAPLGDAPIDPDVVLVWGPPGRVMLLQEAAMRAGVAAQLTTLARPTCMVLPAALAHGVVASTGCIGNRVYTGLDDADLYVAIPGKDIGRVADETRVIRAANDALAEYHRGRQAELAAP